MIIYLDEREVSLELGHLGGVGSRLGTDSRGRFLVALCVAVVARRIGSVIGCATSRGLAATAAAQFLQLAHDLARFKRTRLLDNAVQLFQAELSAIDRAGNSAVRGGTGLLLLLLRWLPLLWVVVL